MRRALPLLILFTLLGCASRPVEVLPNGITPLSSADYQTLINQNTAKSNNYSGLFQTFQVYMTILTGAMQTASLSQKAAFLQWDKIQYQNEREKMLQENSAYSKYFLSFFSPEHDYDDLDKAKSIWKVYLEVSGQRFEGKVKKLKDKFVELKTIYPFFDRFSTPYEITFNVPMTTVENAGSKVILTSSLGVAELAFQARK